MSICIFCNKNKSNTREDIFPLWLQKKFNLFDQKLNLIDGSSIFYRNLKVPACNKCNNETLSKIENKIKTKKAKDLEYYLWVLKIYIGILYKESLLLSTKSKKRKFILNFNKIKNDLNLAQIFFNTYKKKGVFYPDIPGSVIRIKRRKNQNTFDFCDIREVPIIGIALEDEYIIVIPFDKGRIKKNYNPNVVSFKVNSIKFRFFVAELGYDEFRSSNSFSLLSVENTTMVIPSLTLLKPNKFNPKIFKQFLHTVGLNGKYINKKWLVEFL